MISKELISELGDILKEEYGLNLESTETAEIGESLIQYFDVISSANYENEKTKKDKR